MINIMLFAYDWLNIMTSSCFQGDPGVPGLPGPPCIVTGEVTKGCSYHIYYYQMLYHLCSSTLHLSIFFSGKCLFHIMLRCCKCMCYTIYIIYTEYICTNMHVSKKVLQMLYVWQEHITHNSFHVNTIRCQECLNYTLISDITLKPTNVHFMPKSLPALFTFCLLSMSIASTLY